MFRGIVAGVALSVAILSLTILTKGLFVEVAAQQGENAMFFFYAWAISLGVAGGALGSLHVDRTEAIEKGGRG